MSAENPSQLAMEFSQFYCDLVDRHRHHLAHYLADDAILDWFGHSVLGRHAITSFFNDELPYTKHVVETTSPSGPIRHRIKVPSDDPLVANQDNYSNIETPPISMEVSRPLTPVGCKIPRPWDEEGSVQAMSSLHLDEVQASNICNAPIARKKKRWYFDNGQQNLADGMLVPTPNKPAYFLEAFGTMEFIRQNPSLSSAKTLKRFAEQTSCKKRNCKIKLGYSKVNDDVRIAIIVYHDEMRCRKKLLFGHGQGDDISQ